MSGRFNNTSMLKFCVLQFFFLFFTKPRTHPTYSVRQEAINELYESTNKGRKKIINRTHFGNGKLTEEIKR